MANKITYEDKVGIVAKMVHVNQWWDDDANEIKTKHNLNDDRITVLESAGTGILWSNIQDIGDLTEITSPVSTDNLVIERSGVKYKIPLSDVGGSGGAHSSLTGLDYASSGHTGFQEVLTEGSGVEISGTTISSNDSEIDHDSLLNYNSERHLLESELEITVSQISDYSSKQNVFEIVLQSGTSVADRLSKTVVKPSGWTFSTTGLDLVIEHSLGRYATNATVFATTTGTANQQLLNTAAHNGLLNASEDLLRIYSLATVQTEIRIFISFL